MSMRRNARQDINNHGLADLWCLTSAGWYNQEISTTSGYDPCQKTRPRGVSFVIPIAISDWSCRRSVSEPEWTHLSVVVRTLQHLASSTVGMDANRYKIRVDL